MRITHTLLLLLLAAAVMSGCKRHEPHPSDTGKAAVASVSASTSTLAIDSDKFKANIEIPGIEFDGSRMDIDGVKLPKGSAIKGVRITATDKNGNERGHVEFDFASPLAPGAVADHLTSEINNSDWRSVVRTVSADGTILLSATKDDDGKKARLDYSLTADGTAATRGTATITGEKHGKEKSSW